MYDNLSPDGDGGGTVYRCPITVKCYTFRLFTKHLALELSLLEFNDLEIQTRGFACGAYVLPAIAVSICHEVMTFQWGKPIVSQGQRPLHLKRVDISTKFKLIWIILS